VATGCARGAVVSFGFPSRESLGGAPLLQRSPHHLPADPEATHTKA
jgi:hypothetical protein